ncbi:MAG TPA: hypothetical protein VFX53_05150 [Pedococcus sp.]|nr:hypothetical protein [Pedococcus sp.]
MTNDNTPHSGPDPDSGPGQYLMASGHLGEIYRRCPHEGDLTIDQLLHAAQVHATLAQAAAVIDSGYLAGGHGPDHLTATRAAWQAVMSEPPDPDDPTTSHSGAHGREIVGHGFLVAMRSSYYPGQPR